MSDTLVLRAFQALGITASAVIAGGNIAISLAAIPALQQSHVPAATALRQWIVVFDAGKEAAPPACLMASASYAYLIYRTLYSWPSALLAAPNTDLLCGAIAANVGIIAYTLVVMEPGTNARLREMLAQVHRGVELTGKGHGDERVRKELGVWARLNYIRALFPLSGAVLGLWACL